MPFPAHPMPFSGHPWRGGYAGMGARIQPRKSSWVDTCVGHEGTPAYPRFPIHPYDLWMVRPLTGRYRGYIYYTIVNERGEWSV